MKARLAVSSFASAFCLALLLAQTASPQSFESRPRRAEQPLAFNADAPRADDRASAENASVSLDMLVPRDGLQFYFEVRGSSLAQLAQSGAALAPMMKMLAGPVHASAGDFASFAVSQAGALARAKLAFVGYGAAGTAALIEAANETEAEQLRAGVARLLGGRGSNKADEAGIALRGRMVLAGEPPVVSRLTQASAAYPLGEDQLFARAHERFGSDPLFAYIGVGAPQLSALAGAGSPASLTGMLAAFGLRPYAVAMGGRLEGQTLVVRALMFIDQQGGANTFSGLFSSLASATLPGPMMAANFAAADTDTFIDYRIDWEKVVQSLETMFAAFTSTPSSQGAVAADSQPGDPMARAEQSLGFSIRNDLLPALGNELAISISGFDTLVSPQRPAAGAQKGRAAGFLPSRFMVMIGLKDANRFEQLVARFFTKSGAPGLARTAYHGAMINSNKSFAYAVTKDFFILSGSAADIRHALDAYLLGNSLAAAPEFRAATGGARETALQLYLSSAVATKLFDTLQIESAKVSGSVKELAQPAARIAGLGVSVRSDADGMLMEMRAPATLAFAAMAAVATSRPAGPAPAGFGIPAPTTAAPRQANGSRVPKMTEDDVVTRRP